MKLASYLNIINITEVSTVLIFYSFSPKNSINLLLHSYSPHNSTTHFQFMRAIHSINNYKEQRLQISIRSLSLTRWVTSLNWLVFFFMIFMLICFRGITKHENLFFVKLFVYKNLVLYYVFCNMNWFVWYVLNYLSMNSCLKFHIAKIYFNIDINFP